VNNVKTSDERYIESAARIPEPFCRDISRGKDVLTWTRPLEVGQPASFAAPRPLRASFGSCEMEQAWRRQGLRLLSFTTSPPPPRQHRHRTSHPPSLRHHPICPPDLPLLPPPCRPALATVSAKLPRALTSKVRRAADSN
jgi:hypothetical protein